MRDYMSFGGGVQSTAIAMLAINRHPELLRVSGGVVPELYLFADTGDEPESVYENVERMRDLIEDSGARFAIVRSELGRLSDHVLIKAEAGERGISMPPMFVESETSPMPVRRGCTRDFKIKPQDSYAKDWASVPRGCKEPLARQWYGISADEAQRMREPVEKWRTYFYPLCEMGWRRGRCLAYLRDECGMPDVPRSACIYCPFHSNAEWRNLGALERAVSRRFEARVHAAFDEHGHVAGLATKPYLHRSRVPIGDVDFTGGQIDLFGNECAGVCGV